MIVDWKDIPKTDLDDIVSYPDKICELLSNDPITVALLKDNPNFDLDEEEPNLIGTQIFNYNFLPNIEKDKSTYITVDTVVDKKGTGTMKTLNLFVSVICEKNNAELKAGFSLRGNRRDNLICHIDRLIRDNSFGIGQNQLVRNKPVTPVNIGNPNYSAKQIVFEIQDFDNRHGK